MKRDPVEYSERYKSIEKEVARKIMQSFVDDRIWSLEFLLCRNREDRLKCLEEALKRESKAPMDDTEKEELCDYMYNDLWESERRTEEEIITILGKMKSLLDEGQLEYVYEHYILKGLGFCHQYWSCKKRILKEEYGIDWKSPREMNSGILFD